MDISFIDSDLCATNGGKIEFVQNLNMDSIVENVFASDEVIKQVAALSNSITQDIENTTSQINAGLDPMMMFLAIFFPLIIIIGGIVAVVFVFKGLPFPPPTPASLASKAASGKFGRRKRY